MQDTLELMRKVNQIRILTNRLVDERLTGDYHSSFKGQGVEFDEIREYAFGDDVRSIDWNVTARMGYPQIKRFSEERQLTVMLLVDISGSQCFGSTGKTKAELAAEVAAMLALTSIRNQDNVGLILFSDRIHKTIHPRKGRNAVMRIVREVLAAGEEASGGTDLCGALRYLDSIQHRKAIVFLLSDFQNETPEKLQQSLRITARQHDLVCCQISDPAEYNLPAVGPVEVEDPETGETDWIDFSSPALRAEYQAAAAEWEEQLQQLFRRNRLEAMQFSTDSDPILPLRTFFRRRARKHL